MSDLLELPTENLVRAFSAPTLVRSEDDASDGAGELYGDFAVFNEWTEIDSYWEGNFLERLDPTAFDWALSEGRASEGRVQCLYDHGYDGTIGNKPLGPVRSMTPTKTGMAYEVDLIDSDYNRDFIVPAARAELLGASFRMRVFDESVVEPTVETAHNPKMLPERTIMRVELFEFGPTPFGYYKSATAALRSTTDEFLKRCRRDPNFTARLMERSSERVVDQVLGDAKKLGYARNEATHGVRDIPSITHGEDGATQSAGRSYQAAELELAKLRK